jgi:hypothetical protein
MKFGPSPLAGGRRLALPNVAGGVDGDVWDYDKDFDSGVVGSDAGQNCGHLLRTLTIFVL